MKKFKNVILLSGGESTRLWPLGDKNKIEFLSNPLIYYQLNRLVEFTENTLYVVANENNKEFIDAISAETDSRITVVSQKGNGQAAAILSVPDLSGETLIVNVNDFFDDEPIETLAKRLQGESVDALLVAKEMKEYFPGGYLKFKDDSILEIIEKPGAGKTPSDYVRMCIDYFAKIEDFIKVLKPSSSQKDDVYEVGITNYIKQKKTVKFVLSTGSSYHVKYPWQVINLMKFFLSHISQNFISDDAQIAESAKIVGPVYIGSGVKIGDNAKIVGPCFIDENTVVGDFAMIRESHVGKNSLIGGYSEVTRSYLGDSVMFHRNYVGDSVISNNVLFGSGATTANFRFDGKTISSIVKNEKVDTGLLKFGSIIGADSRIGVNSTLLPGVKIGNHSFIGPGEVVRQDVGDEIFLFNGERKKNTR